MGSKGSDKTVLVAENEKPAGSVVLMLELAEAELEQSEGPLSEEPRRTDLEELLAYGWCRR